MSDSLVPSDSGPKFRVAICGAGIGGLILAITLGKYAPSLPVDLYEAHDAIDTVGAGITLWTQTHDVLIDLGLRDEFKQIFAGYPVRTHGPKLRRSDIREGGYVWYSRPLDVRHRPSSLHRQQMIAILEKHLPASCTVHPKKRLVQYNELEREADSTSSIRLEFADGTSATADVLVGADGVRSVVRKSMFEAASEDDGDDETDLKQYVDATFTGMFLYRYLVPAETLRREDPEHSALKDMSIYVGKGRYLVCYPVANGSIVNILAMVHDPSLANTHYEGRWVSEVGRDELIEHYDDFESDAKTVIKLSEEPSRWALHVVKRLPFCVRNRVGLVGDACHAMSPHFVAGGVQAIDDGYILGRLLAHPLMTLSRAQDALRVYEQVRYPFACTIARMSLSTGLMHMFMEPGYYDGQRDGNDGGIGPREREGMEVIREEIMRRWDFVESSVSAPQAWEEAEAKLRAMIG